MSLELETITNYEKVSVMNANFEAIVDEFLNKLDRVSSDDDNSMNQDLDLNGYKILNAVIDDSTYETTMDEYVSNAESTIDDYVEDEVKPSLDTYTTLAQQWASEDEDVLVDDTEYSAKHYAAKAAESAALFTSIDVELTGDVTGTGTLDTETGVIEVETTSDSSGSIDGTEFGLGVGKIDPPSSTGWTWNAAGTSATEESWGMTLINHNVVAGSYAYQDASDELGDGTSDWTVIFKFDGIIAYDNSGRIGVGIGDSDTANYLVLGLEWGSTVQYAYYSGSSAYAGDDIMSVASGSTTVLAPCFFKLAYDATNQTIDCYYSRNGLDWTPSLYQLDASSSGNLDASTADSIFIVCDTQNVSTSARITQATMLGVSFTEELDELKVLVPTES